MRCQSGQNGPAARPTAGRESSPGRGWSFNIRLLEASLVRAWPRRGAALDPDARSSTRSTKIRFEVNFAIVIKKPQDQKLGLDISPLEPNPVWQGLLIRSTFSQRLMPTCLSLTIKFVYTERRKIRKSKFSCRNIYKPRPTNLSAIFIVTVIALA